MGTTTVNWKRREPTTTSLSLPIADGAEPMIVLRHLAIIMDGNGRWAQQRGLPRTVGHQVGVDAARWVVEACNNLGIEVLTLYAFSTENWKRPAREISFLMRLFQDYVDKEAKTLHQNNIQVRFLGRCEGLPGVMQKNMARCVRLTAANTGLVLNIALNYGGRAEIVDATRSVMRAVEREELDPDALDEAIFSRFLYTAGLPDPDLVVRTSGEQRISNFLIWQNANALFWTTSTLWPDVGNADLLAAIQVWRDSTRQNRT